MTKPKMIVIWGCDDILSASIEGLLSAVEGWKVTIISSKDELDKLLIARGVEIPDIIIINQAFNSAPTNYHLQLLHEHPTIKVITVGLDNNLLEVYSRQRIFVKKVSDLITEIESSNAALE